MIGKEDGLLEVLCGKKEAKIALLPCGVVRMPAEFHAGARVENRHDIIAIEKREAFIAESKTTI